MVHLALLAAEKAFASTKLSEAIESISLTDYREFSANDAQIETYLRELLAAGDQCQQCSTPVPPNARFCGECGTRVQASSIIGTLLDEPVGALSLSLKLKERVKPLFPRVGDVVQARREEIMRIKFIKEVRSRIIKNSCR